MDTSVEEFDSLNFFSDLENYFAEELLSSSDSESHGALFSSPSSPLSSDGEYIQIQQQLSPQYEQQQQQQGFIDVSTSSDDEIEFYTPVVSSPDIVQPQQQQQQQQQIQQQQSSSSPSQIKEEKKTQEIVRSLEVSVYQKKRGSGGVWQLINTGERIRVDKIKGKLIKLVVKEANNTNLIDWSDQTLTVDLRLIDVAHPGNLAKEGSEGFTIEQPNRSATPNLTFQGREFKLKLRSWYKSQFFLVTVTQGNFVCKGMSIEFGSDDNGKVQKRKRSSVPDLVEVVRQGLMAYSDIIPGSLSNDLVNIIACSLVPVILDHYPLLSNANNNNNANNSFEPMSKKAKFDSPYQFSAGIKPEIKIEAV